MAPNDECDPDLLWVRVLPIARVASYRRVRLEPGVDSSIVVMGREALGSDLDTQAVCPGSSRTVEPWERFSASGQPLEAKFFGSLPTPGMRDPRWMRGARWMDLASAWVHGTQWLPSTRNPSPENPNPSHRTFVQCSNQAPVQLAAELGTDGLLGSVLQLPPDDWQPRHTEAALARDGALWLLRLSARSPVRQFGLFRSERDRGARPVYVGNVRHSQGPPTVTARLVTLGRDAVVIGDLNGAFDSPVALESERSVTLPACPPHGRLNAARPSPAAPQVQVPLLSVFVQRWDADGHLLAARLLGPGSSELSDVAVIDNDRVAIAGVFRGLLSMDGTSLYSHEAPPADCQRWVLHCSYPHSSFVALLDNAKTVRYAIALRDLRDLRLVSGPGAYLTVFGTSAEGYARWLVLDARGKIIHQREFGSLEVLDALALAEDRMVILAKERFHPRMLLMAWRWSLEGRSS